jgi:zinc protease
MRKHLAAPLRTKETHMKKQRILAFFIGAALMFFSFQAAHAASVTRLANGLTVLIQQDDRFPLASLRLYVHAGSAYETPQQAGISHLLEHMVFKGTEKRPEGGVAGAIEQIGGNINAATSFDYTVYLTDVPSEHWRLGMDVLKDMTFGAKISPEALAPEKEVVLAELERGEDTPGSLLFKRLTAKVLARTPYERPIIGYRETVSAITSKDIHDYIDRLYQPQSMLLVVCGAVNEQEVLAEAEKLFGNLANTRTCVPPQPVTPPVSPAAPALTAEPGKWNKVYAGFALPIPNFHDARIPAVEVLAQMLGGDKTSLLYREFKYDKQLVDDISVSAYSFERTGLLLITAILDPQKTEEFTRELSAALARLSADSFTDNALARAKLNLEDELFRSKETLSGLASKLGHFYFFENGEQSELNYLQSLRQVEKTSVQDILDTFFTPERLNGVLLTPQNAGLNSDNLTELFRDGWPAKGSGHAAPAEKGDNGQQQEVIELGDGRTVVLIPDETLPYTAVDLVFRGGDALLDEDRQGLAALAARVLTKGTQQMDNAALEAFKADRAASLAASAGRSSFTISARYPERFSADITGLFRNVVTAPALAAEETAREKDNQIASIKAREDQPLGLAFRRLFPFLFHNSAYGYLHLGEEQRLAAYTAEDVAGFWKVQRTQPWVLAVCGQFDREEILGLARSLPAPSGPVAVPAVPLWSAETQLDISLEDRNQAHMLMIFKTVPITHEDTPALELLQTVLAGQSGLLFTDLRDKQGLGYTVTAFPWQSEHAGLLAFYIGTDPEKLAQADAGFKKVIRDLQEAPLPEEAIRRGKNMLRGDYYRGRQSLGSRSNEAARLAGSGLPLDFEKGLIEKAEKVDATALQEVARRYLIPQDAYIIRVLP